MEYESENNLYMFNAYIMTTAIPISERYLYRDFHGHSALNLYKLKFQFDFYQRQSEEHFENK